MRSSEQADINDLLLRIQRDLNLEAETEHDVLEEIRVHLEEQVVAAQRQGLGPEQALALAAARFGIEDVAAELQDAHAGWGAADGIAAAALPVICALVLRWLVFAPDGTAVDWQEMLSRPVFWVFSLVALLLPLIRFPRWRYALVSWAVFWILSVVFVALPALRW